MSTFATGPPQRGKSNAGMTVITRCKVWKEKAYVIANIHSESTQSLTFI